MMMLAVGPTDVIIDRSTVNGQWAPCVSTQASVVSGGGSLVSGPLQLGLAWLVCWARPVGPTVVGRSYDPGASGPEAGAAQRSTVVRSVWSCLRCV